MLYVDKLFPALPTGKARTRGTLWCHVWPAEPNPESLKDLHEVALAIGLKRCWFQNRPGFPHYDLVASKRLLAIERGAVEKSLPEWIEERGGLRAIAHNNGGKANAN